MPELTVIKGGSDFGPPSHRKGQKLFEEFITVLLRHLATGEETFRVTASFVRLLETLQEGNLPIGVIFDAAIKDLNKRSFHPNSTASAEWRLIVHRSLRVLAEQLTSDELTNTRLSVAVNDLEQAVETRILDLEERRSLETAHPGDTAS